VASWAHVVTDEKDENGTLQPIELRPLKPDATVGAKLAQVASSEEGYDRMPL
jgi:hypothetical protein